MLGAITLVWVIVWQVLAADYPTTHPRISARERNYIVEMLADQIDEDVTHKAVCNYTFTKRNSNSTVAKDTMARYINLCVRVGKRDRSFRWRLGRVHDVDVVANIHERGAAIRHDFCACLDASEQ